MRFLLDEQGKQHYMLTRLSSLARFALEVAGLGAALRSKITIFLVVMLLPLKQRVPGLDRLLVPIHITLRNRRYRIYVSDRSDFITMSEVLIRREYAVPPPKSLPPLIVDLGAHIGVSVLFFHSEFPGAKIHAVEADPVNFAQLQRNVGDLKNVDIVQTAVGGSARTGYVIRSRLSWGSRVEPSARDPRGTAVDILPLEDLIGRVRDGPSAGSCIVKVDIEGSEWEVLSATDLSQIAVVVGEFHADLAGVSANQFFGLFDGFAVERWPTLLGREIFRAVRPLH